MNYATTMKRKRSQDELTWVAEMRKWTPFISGYFGPLAMTAVRAGNKTSKINLKIETFLDIISRIFGL